MRWLVLSLLLLAGSAHGQPADRDVKKAIFQLGTARLCSTVLNDEAPYEWAKQNLVELVGPDKAAKLIDVMMAQNQDPTPLDEKTCRNMTKNFHD